jgi:hypothetical protein
VLAGVVLNPVSGGWFCGPGARWRFVRYNRGMPTDGQTALVIPVPEADPLLAAVAARFPEAVRGDVPAHVSVLYPFRLADQLDDQVISTLSELFAAQPVMAVSFGECRRRGDFVYLRPAPVEGLDELTRHVRGHWPDVTPYNGLHDMIEPHVTVALRTTPERAAEIEREIVPEWVPIAAELREAWLVVFHGRWMPRQRFSFGG